MSTISQGRDIAEQILEHHGVKGMKWGVRRKRTATPVSVEVKQKGSKLKAKGGQNQPASKDAINTKSIDQVIKKSGYQALSNQDLQAYNNRLNLEANARRLRTQNATAGQRFVKALLGTAGDVAMQEVSNKASTRQVKNSFTTSSTSTALVKR